VLPMRVRQFGVPQDVPEQAQWQARSAKVLPSWTSERTLECNQFWQTVPLIFHLSEWRTPALGAQWE